MNFLFPYFVPSRMEKVNESIIVAVTKAIAIRGHKMHIKIFRTAQGILSLLFILPALITPYTKQQMFA